MSRADAACGELLRGSRGARYGVRVNDRRSLALTVAMTTFACAALVGCAPDAAPTPTPQATFATEEEAFAAAEAVYREYIDAFNRVDLADTASFEHLKDYTAGNYRVGEQESLSELHAERVSRTGEIQIEWFRGTAVRSSSQITARVCNNVSSVDLIDSEGLTLVSPERPSRYAIELTFEARGDAIYLTTSEAMEDQECMPS